MPVQYPIDDVRNIASPSQHDVDGFGLVELPNMLFAQDLEKFWQKSVKPFPVIIKRHLYKNLKRRIEGRKESEELARACKYASINLTAQVKRLKSIINPNKYWLFKAHSIEKNALKISNSVNAYIASLTEYANDTEEQYRYLLLRTSQTAAAMFYELGLVPPFSHTGDVQKLESQVVRYQSEEYLKRHFEKKAAQLREHVEIMLGNVGKHANAYCSLTCVREYLASQKQQKQWLSEMLVQDTNSPENLFYLSEAVESSVSNPKNRRNELMTRIRGLEDIAAESEYSAAFITITAPSKYHRNSGKKYNGSTPQQTQKKLTTMWAKCRAKLQRQGVNYFGVRVTEPHADATPHWHMLLFFEKQDKAAISQIMRDYATREDFEELKTCESARFDFKDIDPSRGSATGYIAKYIAKNIDAEYIKNDIDEETGKPLSESYNSVVAWASRWNIRQFQFLGGAGVGVWRELRRFTKDNPVVSVSGVNQIQAERFQTACNAADNGNFAEYVKSTGGVFQGRSGLFKSLYEEIENQYGETVKKIKGFLFGDFEFITREVKWAIKTAAQAAKALDFERAASRSWSADNNCTASPEMVWQDVINRGSQLQQIVNAGLRPAQFQI